MANRISNSGSKDFNVDGALASGDFLYVQSGDQEIDTNPPAASVDLARVMIGFGFSGSFGTESQVFGAAVSNVAGANDSAVFYYGARDGECWVSAGTNGIDHLVHESGGALYLQGGTTTDYSQVSGSSRIAGAATATNIEKHGGSMILYDGAGSDPTLLRNSKGSLHTERGATTADFTGGMITIDAGTNNFTTMTVNGADVKLKLMQAGTITALNLLSADGIVSDDLAAPLTVTDCKINLAIKGAQEFLNNALVTFTNAPTKIGGMFD